MSGGSIGLSSMQVDSSGRLQSQNGYFTNGYFSGDIYATSGYFNGVLGSNAVYTGYISANQINSGTINSININASNITGGWINGAVITGTENLSVNSANAYSLSTAYFVTTDYAQFTGNRPTYNGMGLATLNDIYGVYSNISTLGATLNMTSFDEAVDDEIFNPDDYISIIKIMKEIIPQETSNIFIIWNGASYFRLKGETTYYSIISKLDYKPIFDIPDSEIVKVVANDNYYMGDNNYPRDCISIEYFNNVIQPIIEQYSK